MRSTISAFVCIFFLSLSTACLAQKFDKAYFSEQVAKTSYDLAEQADAIILFEKCSVEIMESGTGYREHYVVHRIIKVLKSNGAALGNVIETYHDRNNRSAFISGIKGTTYNIDGTAVKETQLKEQDIHYKIPDKFNSIVELVMPDVKEGSVIDYQFEINCPVNNLLPQWEFKNKLPKLASEYEVTAPATFKFNELNTPKLPFQSFASIEEAEQKNAVHYKVVFTPTDKRTKVIWGRKNVTALKPEPFYPFLGNAIETLIPEIEGFNTNERSENWDAFNTGLWTNEHFGEQLTTQIPSVVKLTDSLIKNKNTPIEKARAIFNYVRAGFDCNNNPGIAARRELDQVVRNRIASEAEINLLLTAMLRGAKLTAAPVILSKIGSPRPSPFYPNAKEYNYTISMLKIDGVTYLLDASNKFNIFGVLPIYCYNGYARVVDEKGSSVFWTNKDCKDRNKQEVTITNLTDSTMDVAIVERKGLIESIYLRNILTTDSNGLNEYIMKRTAAFKCNVNLTGISVDNQEDLDQNLTLRYTFKGTRRKAEQGITIAADLFKMFGANPFAAPQRNLPIEFPTLFEYEYLLSLKVPAGLTPEKLPESWSGSTKGNELQATHTINYNKEKQTVEVKTNYTINDPNIPASAYADVRLFFDKLVKELNNTITLKK